MRQKYFTLEEYQEANRRRSKAYYEKNKELIKAKAKDKRRREKEELERLKQENEQLKKQIQELKGEEK